MPKILVIEDDSILCNNIVELLSLDGYDVISASDGIEGINLAMRYQPDLILCDIMMPRMDGQRVLLDVRANSVTQFTPFIFLTAKVTKDDIRQGMQLGADDYVTKPFTNDDLVNAIQLRLDKKAAQEQAHQEQTDVYRTVLAYERQQRLFQEKLVTMLTDDLPQPLESILTANMLLRDYAHQMDEKTRQSHFARIEASVRQLQRTLDDTLLAAQMESGNLQLRRETLDAAELLEQVVSDFQAIYSDAYHLIWQCRADSVLLADPRLLRQIAANLIASSIRYAPQGSTIWVALENAGGGQYRLIVRDERDRTPQSDDISLEIVHRMVDIYDASLQFEQQAGIGTTITLTFPGN